MLVALLWLCSGFTCQDNNEYNDYQNDCTLPPSGCTSTVPSTAVLTIQVSDPASLVSIYKGPYFETGTLISKDYPPGVGVRTWSMSLPLGDYSATAMYIINGDTIVKVDGDNLDYTSHDTCNGTCYTADNGDVDLRLDTDKLPK